MVRLLHDADVPKLCLVSARGHVLGDFALGGRELGTHYIAAWPQSRIGVDEPSRLAAMLRLLAPSRALPPAHLGSDRRIPFR